MNTRVHDPINVREGELVSLMGSRKHPYGNVTAVLDEVTGKLTNTSRAKVSVNTRNDRWNLSGPNTLYLGIWVIRDDVGYLHEVPEPVCNVCEETLECVCVRHTV